MHSQVIQTPALVETSPQTAAAIHLTIARGRMMSAVGLARAEIIAAIRSQGIRPSGRWFMHLLKIEHDLFDFNVCVPVPERILSYGRVEPVEFSAVLRELDAWIRAQGHRPAPDRFQCYLLGPDAEADPRQWETELTRPLLRGDSE